MSVELRLTDAPARINSAPRPRVVRGLLWREWVDHRQMLGLAAAIWLVGGWVVMLFDHVGWIAVYGVLYAWAAGQSFGGSEAAEGIEEHAFALPPSRRCRYLVRLAAGAASVLAFTIAPLVTVAFDLPQKFWGLFVESGYTEPFPPCEWRGLYVLALALPLAFFAMTFALAANSRSRRAVSWSGIAGWVGIGAICIGGMLFDRWLFHELRGYVFWTVLAVVPCATLAAGCAVYMRKEGMSRPEPTVAQTRSRTGLLVVLVLLVALLAVVLTTTGRRQESSAAQDGAGVAAGTAAPSGEED